jgi:hypothetical protein
VNPWLAFFLLALVGVLVASEKVSAHAAGGGAPNAGIGLFAQAIAFAEGFGIAGAIPTVRHNPGDLEYHGDTPDTYTDDAAGWQALYLHLEKVADGRGIPYGYSPDMTIDAFGRRYTATEQDAWIANVVAYLNANGRPDVGPATSLAGVLV